MGGNERRVDHYKLKLAHGVGLKSNIYMWALLAMELADELKCCKWMGKGVDVKYKMLKINCDFVAIFVVGIQPDEDFLWKAIPYYLGDRGECDSTQDK
jgi:hypothetical protein